MSDSFESNTASICNDVSSSELDSTTDVAGLHERLDELQKREQQLLQHQSQLETDFGIKRAKFKDLFLKKEDELNSLQEQYDSILEQLSLYKDEQSKLYDELEGVKTAAALSENNKLEEIKHMERHYESEIASLKQIIQGTTEEIGMEANKEKQELSEENEKLKLKLHEIQKKLNTDSEGFMSSIAKTLQKKVSPFALGSFNVESNSMEESMRKAQFDSEILKSVIMPLEEEISGLKSQLADAQNQISKLTNQKNLSLPSLEGISLEDKVTELMSYLRAEKAARSDLEMYVAVLNTQKDVLQEDTEELKSDLEDVFSILEREKKGHQQLKLTWEAANDQFLESQRLMMKDLRRMERVLTEEQQRQVAELRKVEADQVDEESSWPPSRDEPDGSVKQFIDDDAIHLASIKEKKIKRKGQSQAVLSGSGKMTDSLDASRESNHLDALVGLKKSASGSQLSINSQDIAFLDSGIHETRAGRADEKLDADNNGGYFTLTDEQVKAIRDPTPDAEARLSLMASAKAQTAEGECPDRRRVVSDKEWELLQKELLIAREKLGRPCDMCSNYEAQLQSVQKEAKENFIKVQSLNRHLDHEKQASANQVKYQTELEQSLKEVAEDIERQLLELTSKVAESEKYISEVRHQYESSLEDLYLRLNKVTEGRESIYRELGRLQSENDTLIGLHSRNVQQIQTEDINLPNDPEGMQMHLLQCREEIIAAKVAKEYNEQILQSQILFLKDQLQSEQQEKSTMEEALSVEIATLQDKVGDTTTLQSQLSQEKQLRSESDTRLQESDHALKSTQAKSKQLIHALQRQVEEQSKARTQLEIEVESLKSKVKSLQTDLSTSETVQRDFVKLSQSLQMQLEKIRQAETEVRWEHEEDVDECNNCKQMFTVTKRKHHCKHCGRIFCAECISKSVNSGPNLRSSKVCDVCHTILVNDATPYFSTEPPASAE